MVVDVPEVVLGLDGHSGQLVGAGRHAGEQVTLRAEHLPQATSRGSCGRCPRAAVAWAREHLVLDLVEPLVELLERRGRNSSTRRSTISWSSSTPSGQRAESRIELARKSSSVGDASRRTVTR